jgi:integrase
VGPPRRDAGHDEAGDLGAFARLRAAEIVALRVTDVDFMRGVISPPAIQYPGVDFKSETSRTPIPIPQELALELNRIPAAWGSDHAVTGAFGKPISRHTPWKRPSVAREAESSGSRRGSGSTTSATASRAGPSPPVST